MEKKEKKKKKQQTKAEQHYPGATEEYAGPCTKKQRVKQDVRMLNNNPRNNELDE